MSQTETHGEPHDVIHGKLAVQRLNTSGQAFQNTTAWNEPHPVSPFRIRRLDLT